MLPTQTQTTRLGKWQVSYLDKTEFHLLKREIFQQENYLLEIDTDALNQQAGCILDIGSHIGLSCLYFRQYFPTLPIEAYEPHPFLFELLEHNIWQNQLENITLHQQAIMPSAESISDEGTVTFHTDPDGSWLSNTGIHQGTWEGTQKSQTLPVQAISVTEAIENALEKHGAITLMKLDVEGLEEALLRASTQFFEQIQTIVFEFHPHQTQKLHPLVELLQQHGYHVTFGKNGAVVNERLAKGLSIVRACKQ